MANWTNKGRRGSAAGVSLEAKIAVATVARLDNNGRMGAGGKLRWSHAAKEVKAAGTVAGVMCGRRRRCGWRLVPSEAGLRGLAR
ncbi:hypothetical protein NL676_031458 [Syzygium grande]|nr:hypothetical protein NL676_031458 [Syzygium grande]